ncbi:MAG: phosphoenolpyruvate mutase [Clostridiales bacterium]|jgi:phosphoenolpyruvate mutase|nr:phosphoenolpyruvate mutase [Clostridiales bacterium]
MKALILNSGMGARLGAPDLGHPKCMTEIGEGETILSRQLKQLADGGVFEVVITTGLFDQVLVDYVKSLGLPMQYTFVKNPKYETTNYIYSIYLAREHLQDDILLMHGDLVMEDAVLYQAVESRVSCMAVSSTRPLPEKDFKAVIQDGLIRKVGLEFFENALSAQPIYKLNQSDWQVWLEEIAAFCERGETGCYAENALNQISQRCEIHPLEVGNLLCGEIDTPEDLEKVRRLIEELAHKTVYMCFSTDTIHSAHIRAINKAARLGKLIVGVLTDEAVASYRRFPLLRYEDRSQIVGNINGVSEVVPQYRLSYADNLRKYRPDYVIHGDDWREGVQQPVREEVLRVLSEYGGQLVEFPYVPTEQEKLLEHQARAQLSIPDFRRGMLRRLLSMKGLVRVIEAHSGITGLIAEKTTVVQDGQPYQFDGMWVSSLCDSTAKGKPDIELVDMSSRMRTIDDIMEVTTKPIILDGDTGGLVEHFVYNVKTLERMGVSAVIIEDKTGLKKNSLFGTEVAQTQDSIENFCNKIAAGKNAQKTDEFMIIARVESLILEQGMEDALKRAFAYVEAGADGVMIHSRRKDPAEIFEFVEKFREKDKDTPIVVVPTSFNSVTEDEFKQRGVNIVIYANQLTRSGFPAMQKVARTILATHRAKEADDMCMSIKEILTLIPEE